jgi:preprotein translocase subunit YajC
VESALIQLVQLAQMVPDGGGGSPWSFPLLMGAVALFFYALIIRPQRQQEKAQQAMRAGLAKGDPIVTAGGIHGKVVGIADDIVTVEIADRVRVKLNRSAIATRIGKPAGDGAEETKR